jgi:hypothetical protein
MVLWMRSIRRQRAHHSAADWELIIWVSIAV